MTYTISRYPVHLIDVMHAADGTRLTVRPTLPQDVELQREFFRALSAKSRYSRFLTKLSELPPSLAERFENIDYHGHVALLAAVFNPIGRESMVAEARYVLDEHDPNTCEFAIAVADERQGRGIATTLLARLERQALRSGVRKMTALTLSTNEAMLRLAQRAGYTIGQSPDDRTVMVLEKALVCISDASRCGGAWAA